MAKGGKIVNEICKTEKEMSEAKNITHKSSGKTRKINEKTPIKNLNLCTEVMKSQKFESLKTPRTSLKKGYLGMAPRISTRRRSLFNENKNNCVLTESEKVSFDGIEPLSPVTKSVCVKKLRKSDARNFNINEYSLNNKTQNSNEKLVHRTRLSPRMKKKESNTNEKHTKISIKSVDLKTTNTEELQKLFNNVNLLNNRGAKQFNDSIEEIVFSTDEDECQEEESKKRSSTLNLAGNQRNKLFKKDNSFSPELEISTKSFYSSKRHSTCETMRKNPSSLHISETVLKMIPQLSTSKHHNKIKRVKVNHSGNSVTLANRGVGHGIRKHSFKLKHNIKSIDDFLKTIKCERLKSLPSKRILPEKIEEVHNIFKTVGNPIEMSRPLIIDCEKDISSRFSNSDESEVNESDDENSMMNIENQSVFSNIKTCSLNISPLKANLLHSTSENNLSPIKTKKFFKSGHTSIKEVKITDNIKLGVSCGKMSLLSEKKKKPKNLSKTFINEQAVVDDIIKSLAISPEKNNIENVPIAISFSENSLHQKINNEINDNVSVISSTLKLQDDLYKDFRARIPYQTSDSNEIERQSLLLDFLITNNICTEKNFIIFIADPDNHKEEADEIINNMVEVVNDDTYRNTEDITLDPYEHFRNQIPYNTNDPIRAREQGILLDFLIENNICTEENFTIFIKELEFRKDEAEKIIESVASFMQIENTSKKQIEEVGVEMKTLLKPNEKTSSAKSKLYPIFYCGKKYVPIENKFLREKKTKNLWRGALGQNQYQIDAGQTEFGATQCPKCGLVYTVHEPEEEIIHEEYHNSMYFLKFRGWIDEDVIGKYFEWSNDGRIIRITSSEHTKKKDRLLEFLKIVDKELGFASYILPAVFVAFLAVRKNQFVGLCLVQFLNKANRYVKINGVDCCTEEIFDAKLGISRIWVSPFCRRMGIASKLLAAARSHSIIGDLIDIEKVAFSAPTEDGKLFAQKISKRTDFLIYQ